MAESTIRWPVKTRDLHDSIFDSRVWDTFDFRDDDIVIATWAKAGTTWTQQIVGQLIFNGQENVPVAQISPWVDFVAPPLEAILEPLKSRAHRRFVKTHLPLDALTFSPSAKYLYIGRDGRDTVWSMHNHHTNLLPEFRAHLSSNPRRGPGPDYGIEPAAPDVVQYFREWLARDGYPYWPFWENIRTWWSARDLPNVLLVHFANLKRDMPAEIRRIAKFLDISIDEACWPAIVEHCTFDYMREHAQYCAPAGGVVWEGGGKTFINKGTNGRWHDRLTPEDVRAYEERARAELGEECAHWLATGELPA